MRACSADIAWLSQFRHEREVLFPPCTMLVVNDLRQAEIIDSFATSSPTEPSEATVHSPQEAAATAASKLRLKALKDNLFTYLPPPNVAQIEHEAGRTYCRLDVLPCFV